MHSAKMEMACRKMAESYVDYEMTGRNLGMKMVREHIVSDRAVYYEMLRE